MTKKKPSETVQILLALIEANVENVRLFDFKDFSWPGATDDEIRSYMAGFKDGAERYMCKLKIQLSGKDQ